MSLLNVINLACHQVGRTRCPPSPAPPLSASQSAATALIHGGMWNYGPLHLVMKSQRSWRAQPAHANRAANESEVRAFEWKRSKYGYMSMCELSSDDALSDQRGRRAAQCAASQVSQEVAATDLRGQLQSCSGNKQP